MASRSSRRSQRRSPRRRRGVLVCAAAAAVAIVISLVVALRPDHQADDGAGTVASAAGARVIVPPTTPEPTPSPTPSATRSPAPKATPTVAAAAKPKPKATPKPPATGGGSGSGSGSGGVAARPASGSAPLAGRIQPGTTYTGVATFYDTGSGDGACLFGPTSDTMTAAMNTADYETSMACGAYILVRAASGASVTVRITNECPGDCLPGQLDLSPQAFAKLAAPVTGRIPITWSLLSPSAADPVSIRYKTGSSKYWCGIQVIGHRNPLARLEVRTGSGWVRLARTSYNYFLSEQGTGCGGAIRISDIYGEQLTIDGITVRPDVVQPTRVQFAAH
ncbi:expansin EXLX1 family cellulose-binding protein [Streptomyces turgidiscabies]|uniref:Tat pathway signal sequence domain protein n=1 Tax=Streptomyces turgidiscabies (strain Car8) TaxID=698760 RepID=L7FB59_STRT8|nr:MULTISPECIES: expansin EXLX1 family cellulose-binding protein [Streptomyces]ELP68492.1 Tat pathway signal sequence domain protein [Streptomyces turgidiscabies Car8]MDX3494122.1 expansin EXLX1 family cellulose-binding protein [Streptomyces turgidiscabies]GAQ68507.1 expansin-YoaJ precursor [Streptomyces turgidiscabies]